MDNIFKLPVPEHLVELGYLTKEKIRDHPLKYTNLQSVLKIYAINTHIPFKMSIYGNKNVSTEYYLTDCGLEYVYSFFRDKTLKYVRSIFNYLFTNATEYNVKHPEEFSYFDNFRGTKGIKTKAGSKQPALVVHKVGNAERKYRFESIADARDQLKIWFTLYPIEDFTLYRIRTDKRGYEYKEKIKLIVERKYNLKEYNESRRAETNDHIGYI